jgi:hypothetical protein
MPAISFLRPGRGRKFQSKITRIKDSGKYAASTRKEINDNIQDD